MEAKQNQKRTDSKSCTTPSWRESIFALFRFYFTWRQIMYKPHQSI